MATQTRVTTDLPPPAGRRARRWRRIVTLSTLGGLVAFGLSGGITGSGPFGERLKILALCLIYGHGVGLGAAFALPQWLKRFGRRNRASWWAARVLALPIVCFVGGAAALILLVPLGLMPRASYLNYLFPYARFGPALPAVATIFLAVTGYEYLRERLDATTLALRTKERDEAEARRLATEAQLASLESRVQPHFLFNTLNSIAALIPADPAGAERMTGQLASLLRSSLETAATSLVPLAQEMKTVRDYLDIERVRFGDRLRYAIDVPHELGTLQVPRLSVQTLVENAVKYAVTPRREGAAIGVLATADGERARLSVEDDGPGFEAAAPPERHGLALLRERLAITFGDEATLTVRSRPGRTVVVIELPTGPHNPHEWGTPSGGPEMPEC